MRVEKQKSKSLHQYTILMLNKTYSLGNPAALHTEFLCKCSNQINFHQNLKKNLLKCPQFKVILNVLGEVFL